MPSAEYVSVEPKFCEICGRSFVREVGSAQIGCREHRYSSRGSWQEEFPLQFSAEYGQIKQRSVRLYLTMELARHVRDFSAFGDRAIALAAACELLDKTILTTKDTSKRIADLPGYPKRSSDS